MARLRLCFDRILPDALQPLAAQLAIAERPDNRPFGASPVEMAVQTGKLWAPGRTLRCAFLGGDPGVQGQVAAWAKTYEQVCNIKLQFGADPQAEIRIAFNPDDGSWSNVGTDCLVVPPPQPTMNFGWLDASSSPDDYSSVVLHEFGHALGAIHEHQSPAAGIPWNIPKVYQYFEGPPNNWPRAVVDQNVLQKYGQGGISNTVFDPTSIMCYAFGPPLTLNNYATPWNTQLSAQDRSFLASLYPFTAPPPGPPQPPGSLTDLKLGVAAGGAIASPGQTQLYRFSAAKVGLYIVNVVITAGAGPVHLEVHKGSYPSKTNWSKPAPMQLYLARDTYYVLVRASDGRALFQYAIGVGFGG